jgi:hypothetical protein
MDKVKKYQQAILEVLQEYRQQFRLSNQNVHNQIVADERGHHYQFLWMGWQNDNHVFSVAFHIDIVGDKIWVQQDNTEVGVANLLAEKGIPKSEIVLAYFPASHRKYTEYAVA